MHNSSTRLDPTLLYSIVNHQKELLRMRSLLISNITMWRELGPTHQVISFLPYVWDTLACSEYSSIYNNSSEIMSLTSLTSKTLLMK